MQGQYQGWCTWLSPSMEEHMQQHQLFWCYKTSCLYVG